MGLNTDISEVITQIDKIITSKDGRWLEVSDYNLKSKDRKNMKSVYGLFMTFFITVIMTKELLIVPVKIT